MIVGIIGLGFVGNAIYQSFLKKNIEVVVYDKYKNIGNLESCLNTSILFLALPTVYDSSLGSYNKQPIYETCDYLNEYKYNGGIIIKSTVEPTSTEELSLKFSELNFIHNPEFLKANTAEDDFHNQTHIVLGKSSRCNENVFHNITDFYKSNYPNAKISLCSSMESEMMKIYVNSFYSVKIQFFTEMYLTCQKVGTDFKTVRDMMLANEQIHPSFTNVPGHDGQISYGGLCFPKDTNAINQYMIRNNIPNGLLEACIKERNKMRNDHDNCHLY
jgi:UDPglucose 6-dehydrogenase